MFGSNDITFCRSKCYKTDCFRHESHIPKNEPVSVAYLKGTTVCKESEMSYKKTMNGVTMLVQNEYDMAAEEHGPVFHSNHEAFSVIIEEVAESREELAKIVDSMGDLWSAVRNDEVCSWVLSDIENHAMMLACEAIQVAAMARKAM